MQKSRKLIALMICLFFVVALAGNFGVVAHAENKTKYDIGTDTTFAPFEFEDVDGKFVGIDMDLLAAIAKDQNFEYTIKPLGFNAAVQALETNQVDGVIAGMSITDERKRKFDFPSLILIQASSWRSARIMIRLNAMRT